MSCDSRFTIYDLRSASRSRWLDPVVIVALSIPFLFWGIGSIDFLDPDEGMYGSIALEMAETGDWITPHFDGVRYLEKPPLHFWLSALAIRLFGPSEWAVRIWSALPALGTAFLVWRLGNLIYGRLGGLLSALVLLSSVGVFRYARVAATDWLLVFSVTLALYAFVKSCLLSVAGKLGSTVHFSRFTIHGVLFWLGCALGVLSKGLIGVVFPLLIVGLFFLAGKLGGWEAGKLGSQSEPSSLLASEPSSFPAFKPVFSLPGFLLFLALVVPWHLLAASRNPGFFEFYVIDNQFLRFLNQRSFLEDDVPVTTLRFLILTLVWFFPWSLFLLPGLRQGFPAPRGTGAAGRLRWIVGLWALVVLGFFSFSSSKLEHYFLPASPPLSLMVGATWAEAAAKSPVEKRAGSTSLVAGLEGSLWSAALGCLLVGLAAVYLSGLLTADMIFSGLAELNVYYRVLRSQGAAFPFAEVEPFARLVETLGWMVALGLPLALLLFSLRRPLISFALVLVVAAGVAGLVMRLLWVIEPHHSAKAVATALRGRSGASDLIVHEGPLEYSGSLPFYTRRRIAVLAGRRGDLDFGSSFPESRHLFFERAEFRDLWEGWRRVFLVTRFDREKSVVGSLPEGSVFLLGRYGSRSLFSNAPESS